MSATDSVAKAIGPDMCADRSLPPRAMDVLVWWVAEPARLSRIAWRTIEATEDEVVVSTVSLFEISTRVRRGRLELEIYSERWLAAQRSSPPTTSFVL